MQKERYPKDWAAISQRIRHERAKGRCEWCGAENGQVHPVTGTKVVLTVAHLGAAHEDGRPGDKHDKLDVRECNLAALCQRCHLNYDRDEHIANQRRNRVLKRMAQGQGTLLDGAGLEPMTRTKALPAEIVMGEYVIRPVEDDALYGTAIRWQVIQDGQAMWHTVLKSYAMKLPQAKRFVRELQDAMMTDTTKQPVRVQRKYKTGSRLPRNTVFVGSGTRWSNPFRWQNIVTLMGVRVKEARHIAVVQYEQYLQERPDLVAAAGRVLRGVNLACWCRLDEKCHADVLLKVANQ